MEQVRLQKVIANLGITSRRNAEEWIKAGRVAVNGNTVKVLGTKINSTNDQIAIDGKKVDMNRTPPKVYWMFHKRKKSLTARTSERGIKTIFEEESLKKLNFQVTTAGRLDYLSEGLLLMSNDGELIHRLTHPKYKLPRYYSVLVDRRLEKEEEKLFQSGVVLDGDKTLPCELAFAHSIKQGEKRYYWYFVTVFEGRNRLIRRLFANFNSEVQRLVRYGFGPLRLPESLKPGSYVQLSSNQISQLKDLTKSSYQK